MSHQCVVTSVVILLSIVSSSHLNGRKYLSASSLRASWKGSGRTDEDMLRLSPVITSSSTSLSSLSSWLPSELLSAPTISWISLRAASQAALSCALCDFLVSLGNIRHLSSQYDQGLLGDRETVKAQDYTGGKAVDKYWECSICNTNQAPTSKMTETIGYAGSCKNISSFPWLWDGFSIP